MEKNMDGSCASIPAYRERMQQFRRLNDQKRFLRCV